LYDAIDNPVDDLFVVFSTAYLDRQLGAMLKYVLVQDKANTSGTVLASGSVSSFAARITMAYCLGLVSPYCYTHLKILADIRNRFAHSIGHVSFKDQKVQALCRKLVQPNVADLILPDEMWPPKQRDYWSTPRMKFQTVLTTISMALMRSSIPSVLDKHRCTIKPEPWAATVSERFAHEQPRPRHVHKNRASVPR
jgi:DNA-binding MltR family transcriptional regulator